MATAPNNTGTRVILLLRLLAEPSEFGFTREEIAQRIPQYRESGMSRDAQRKMIEHDIAAIKAAGIILDIHKFGQFHAYKARGVEFKTS